jgi:hypothetical protein
VDISPGGLRAAGRRLEKLAAGQPAAAGALAAPPHAAVVRPGQPAQVAAGDAQLGAAVGEQQQEVLQALEAQRLEALAPLAPVLGAMLPPLPRRPGEARREARRAVLQQLGEVLEAPAAAGLPVVATERHRWGLGLLLASLRPCAVGMCVEQG